MTGPVYKSASFWTMIVGLVAQIVIGYGFQLEAEMLVTITATVVAYLVQRGIIAKAEVQALGHYRMGFDDGQAAAYEQIEKAD
jgi:uncharacterized membrane protein